MMPKFWHPQPEYSRRRERIKAIVFHWGASFNPKIGRSARLDEMWRFYQRTLAAHSYHALIKDGSTWQTIPWDMTAGALGLPDWRDYPEDTIRRFGITGWGNAPDAQCINVLMIEEEENGKFRRQTIDSAAQLGAYLCARYARDPFEDVLRHSDVTWKGIRPVDHKLYDPHELPCPRYFVEHEEAWTWFLHEIKDRLA